MEPFWPVLFPSGRHSRTPLGFSPYSPFLDVFPWPPPLGSLSPELPGKSRSSPKYFFLSPSSSFFLVPVTDTPAQGILLPKIPSSSGTKGNLMQPQNIDNLTLKDEIINVFRPIEQLFRIMDTSGLDVDGTIIRCYAEIGLDLTGTFREKLEKLLGRNQDGADNAEG